MNLLIAFSKKIDHLNQFIADKISWLLLIAVLICSGSAMVSYFFKIGSNGWFEIQWYLYSAVFLLSAGYTLKRNEHVRIDVLTHRFSRRTQVWIDVFGFIFFLFPMAGLIIILSWPFAMEAMANKEMSNNAGGLIVWPIKLLIPLSFALLLAQGISELIKRIAFLTGDLDETTFGKDHHPVENEIHQRGAQADSR